MGGNSVRQDKFYRSTDSAALQAFYSGLWRFSLHSPSINANGSCRGVSDLDDRSVYFRDRVHVGFCQMLIADQSRDYLIFV